MRLTSHSRLFLLLLLLPAPALAQETEDLRSFYRIELPQLLEVASGFSRSAPGTSAGTPTAFGAQWGDGFIGAGYQQRTRYRDENDGAVVGGFGLGNARDYLGLEIAISSFSTLRQGFGTNMGASAKLHRVLPWSSAIAVGWENFWHGQGTDGGSSLYAVASKVFNFREGGEWFSTATASVGAGNGRFRSEEDVQANVETVNFFGSLGVRVAAPVALIADWTGQDLALALSIAPFAGLPLVITPAVVDVTERAGDGPRFSLGAGLGLKWGDLVDLVGGLGGCGDEEIGIPCTK